MKQGRASTGVNTVKRSSGSVGRFQSTRVYRHNKVDSRTVMKGAKHLSGYLNTFIQI